MKKFIIFVLSFVLLFSILVFSTGFLFGLFQTLSFVPDVNEAWNTSANLPQEIKIYSSSSPFPLILLIALLSAVIAYFTAQKFPRHN